MAHATTAYVTDGGITVHELEKDAVSSTEDIVMSSFISPKKTTESRSRELFLADGKKMKAHLEERLRVFPEAVRYDTRGNELYAELTRQEDAYYCGECEKAILRTRMDAIAAHIPDGASIVELGCGSMEKTEIVLDHLRSIAQKKGMKFYALDIDRRFLERSLHKLKESEETKHVPEGCAVSYAGILGSYDQAVAFLPQIPGPRVLLWMGTSMGNMTRLEAADLLNRYCHAMEEEDMFFVGIDKKKEPKIIARAYNDPMGLCAELGMNTLVRLNKHFGVDAFDLEKFGRVAAYNEELGRMEMYIKSLEEQTVTIPPPYSGSDGGVSVRLKKDEWMLYCYSVKYSKNDLCSLAASAEMTLADIWTDPKDAFYFCLFKKTAAEE